MAAANSSSIRQPYHIILAGAHDAGKSTIFNTLVTEFEDSFKFKADDKRSRQGVQFESFRHKYMDKGEMRLLLQDTAGMEKEGGVRTMTRGYFREAIGVILVYDTSNLESLNKLHTWVTVTREACIYSDHLVYAIWGNEKDIHFSSICNPVKDYHLRDLIDTLPIQVERQLVCSFNGMDQTAVAGNYETLVRTIQSKIEVIDTTMKRVPVPQENPTIVLNPHTEEDEQSSCACACK